MLVIGDREIKNDANELDRVNELWIGLLAKNCCIKEGYQGLRKIIKENDNQNIYLGAEDAKKFGIVDEIGVPAINTAGLYEVIKAKDHRGEHIKMEEFQEVLQKLAGKKKKSKKKTAKKKPTKTKRKTGKK